jgi:hypothetical protein
MDGTIKDKLMLFRIKAGYKPNFSTKNSDNENRVIAELPFFLRWILDYKVNPKVVDPCNSRFVIRSFHHDELIEEANSEQPESRLAEMISEIMKHKKSDVIKGDLCKMNVTELMQLADVANLGKQLHQLGGIRNVGKLLTKVIEQRLSPYLIEKNKKDRFGNVSYTFNPHATS